jgi:hypothetical protein
MKNPAARPQGIKIKTTYAFAVIPVKTGIQRKKTGFRIPRLRTSRAGKCRMTKKGNPVARLQGITS